jgi:hypothetical protein
MKEVSGCGFLARQMHDSERRADVEERKKERVDLSFIA